MGRSRNRPPRLPEVGRYFFSLSDYEDNASLDPELVVLYARNDQGLWFANGLHVLEDEVPDDLWEVRLVQR